MDVKLAGTCCVLVVTLTISNHSAASDTVSEKDLFVLDFELNDLTLNPDTAKETERAAQLRPMLSAVLQDQYGWNIKELDEQTRSDAQKGKGYLFDRPQASGRLGHTAKAKWVVTGRLHKASFLFVYLKSQLVDTSTLTVKADFVVEIKGAAPKLTRKGIETLAMQISEAINKLQTEAVQ